MQEMFNIEKDLENLSYFYKNMSIEELKENRKKCRDIFKLLVATKNYYQKQENKNLGKIRELIKKAKRIDKDITEILEMNKKNLLQDNKKKIKIYSENLELTEVQKIISNVTNEKKIKLNDIQTHIKSEILKNKDVSQYNIKDILMAFTSIILNNLTIENYTLISEYSHIINNYLSDYLFENGEMLYEYILLLDILKYEIYKTKKDDQSRKILKKVYSDLKNTYKVYKCINNEKKEEKNSYFDVIMYWLNDEKNYMYINELLKRKNEIYNIRYNNKHIVMYILDLYIRNFKSMVSDKNSDYINLHYLEEVYYLFTKSPYLRVTKDERISIDLKLKNFTDYIKETLISQKRKNYAIDTIKKMKSKYFYKKYLYYEFLDLSDDELLYEQTNLLNLIKYNTGKEDITRTYLYNDNVYKIHFEKDEKSNKIKEITLTLYEIMYSRYIALKSIVNNYLEKCEMNKEEVDSFFKKGLCFKVNKKYPVIAYELKFYPSGKFMKLNVKKDTIIVKKIDEKNKAYIDDLYKKSTLKNLENFKSNDTEDLNNYFKKILEKGYIDFLAENRLPFIYYGRTMPTRKEIENQINYLSNSLYSMSKDDYAEIINIISNDIDKLHYANLPIENGFYELSLLNPISFLGIENQRMLDDLYFNKRLLSDERLHKLKLEYLNRYIKMVKELNENIEYVDYSVIKNSKGKIKNRIKL